MPTEHIASKQNLREYRAVAHLVNALATMCAASPTKVVDLLSGYLWDDAETDILNKLVKEQQNHAEHSSSQL